MSIVAEEGADVHMSNARPGSTHLTTGLRVIHSFFQNFFGSDIYSNETLKSQIQKFLW